MVIVVNRFKKSIKQSSRKIREAVAELTAKAFEVVSGLRIVKSFRMEHHEANRSEEHTSELQSPYDLVCRLLLEKKKNKKAEKYYGNISRDNKDGTCAGPLT